MKMLSETEIKKKEEVLVAISDWILAELKNTSSMNTESILPEIIKIFLGYCDD